MRNIYSTAIITLSLYATFKIILYFFTTYTACRYCEKADARSLFHGNVATARATQPFGRWDGFNAYSARGTVTIILVDKMNALRKMAYKLSIRLSIHGVLQFSQALLSIKNLLYTHSQRPAYHDTTTRAPVRNEILFQNENAYDEANTKAQWRKRTDVASDVGGIRGYPRRLMRGAALLHLITLKLPLQHCAPR